MRVVGGVCVRDCVRSSDGVACVFFSVCTCRYIYIVVCVRVWGARVCELVSMYCGVRRCCDMFSGFVYVLWEVRVPGCMCVC